MVGAKPGFEICCKSLLNIRKFVEIFFYCVKSQELLAMRIIRAVTDRRQIISFPFFVYIDTLEDKSYLVYFVDVSSAGSRGGARGGRPPPLFLVQTEAQRAEKIFLGDRPLALSNGPDDRPPLISKVWIRLPLSRLI